MTRRWEFKEMYSTTKLVTLWSSKNLFVLYMVNQYYNEEIQFRTPGLASNCPHALSYYSFIVWLSNRIFNSK